MIVDDITVRIFLCKEYAFVISDGLGKCFVRYGHVCEASGIKSSHVMPVPSEAVTPTELTLGAKDVDRRGLFPKGSLGPHDLWRCGRKLHPL